MRWTSALHRDRLAGKVFLAGILGLLGFIGCRQPSEPATGDAPQQPAAANSRVAAPLPAAEPASNATFTPTQYWETFYIEGTKIGYGHTSVELVEEGPPALLQMKSETHISMQRFGQTVSQQIHLTSVETLSGELVRFSSELLPDNVLTRGSVADGALHLETQSPGMSQQATIPWKPSYKGLFASQRSLELDPMEPGEQRSFESLVPIFNQIGKIEMKAAGLETTSLLSGSAELLRIDATLEIAGQSIRSVYWTSPQGVPLKTSIFVANFEQVAYRTDRATALREEDQATPFDLGNRSMVRLESKLENPHDKRLIEYRARLSGRNPVEVFVADGSQSVESIDEQTALIRVRAVRPGGDPPAAAELPTAADREANSLVQSDDEQIVALARAVKPDATDAWELACALEAFVYQTVENKTFSRAMASAADVARTREGDCTEHAVLLAALCRARGLPARVAIGLVYFSRAQAFAYHMWNEVWIEDRWIPLDGTLGRCGIGAAHLKVSISSLEGATPHVALLPVIELLGNLELSIEHTE